VVWDQVYFAGRALKGQGYFKDANRYFEHCLEIDRLRKPKQILVKSNLADLYIELDYIQRKGCNSNNSFLDNAEETTKLEIGRLKVRGKHSKGFRRLVF
jgi:hypothetical protein